MSGDIYSLFLLGGGGWGITKNFLFFVAVRVLLEKIPSISFELGKTKFFVLFCTFSKSARRSILKSVL